MYIFLALCRKKAVPAYLPFISNCRPAFESTLINYSPSQPLSITQNANNPQTSNLLVQRHYRCINPSYHPFRQQQLLSNIKVGTNTPS